MELVLLFNVSWVSYLTQLTIKEAVQTKSTRLMKHETHILLEKKIVIFYKCYQILKDHPKFDLNTTCSNSQHSRFRPLESGGSFVNLEYDSSPIDIKGPDSNWPIDRNETKLQQKGREEIKVSLYKTLPLKVRRSLVKNMKKKPSH